MADVLSFLLSQILLYSQPTDMRKSFDALCGVVRNELKRDPLSGEVFIFLNRGRTHLALLINVISAPLYVFIVEGLYNVKRLPLLIKAMVLFRNKEVRLSIAYLFRIKHNGKYLLVKNRKWGHYQLVGGAYKAYPEAKKIFKERDVKPDRIFETDQGIETNDLRFTVPGRYVIKMIDWFESRQDRNLSMERIL